MLLLVQAFDQQQQDLVDAASKALSYRQDIIEENIRLTYALQVTFPPSCYCHHFLTCLLYLGYTCSQLIHHIFSLYIRSLCNKLHHRQY
jgi:hypothetical protein